ncbi:hypothetical protein CesoFtcFv8_017673 [Champsocephalus esox]|uniref:Uncharacterized protein n=1 Tax=Champsocephalus esox TaxID=159716 RepID=A0AAN8BKC4_9TELE|nr:hypothetical protein CesoFtcFv8_017673 [Champsocephalus esox]
MESVDLFGCTSPVNTVLKRRPNTIPGLSSPEMSTKNAHCRDLFSPGPAAVLSPVTNLALDMNNWAGLGSLCDTPKRRKHAALEKIPSFASDVSSDAGLGMDPMDAQGLNDSFEFEKTIQQASRVINDRMPIRRINSLPLQLQLCSPPMKRQETDSHRYGIFGQQPSQMTAASCSSQRDNKENMPEECFEFKKPTKPVSRCRVRSLNSGQAFAHRPSSAPALMVRD